MSFNKSFSTLHNAQLEAIMTALAANAMVIDDHGPSDRRSERAIDGVALVETSQGVFVCQIYRQEWTSLNQLYIGADGFVHLSTRSVSGNLQGFPCHSEHFRLDTLESVRAAARIGDDVILDVRWFDDAAPRVRRLRTA